MSEVFERSKTQGNARLVLLSLADSCNDDASCWPSIRKIAEKANISEPITKKYLNALIQIGVITRDEREDFSGRQTSNLYTINVEKIGDDEITQDIIHQVTSPSRLKTFKGITAVNVGVDNPVQMVVGVTKVSLPIMNHNKEPKIEPSRESSAVASHSSVESTQPNLFPTNLSEANASGSATAKLNSADGKETTPHCAPPPRTRKSREPKPVDEKFIAELQRLNPDKDVEREAKDAQTWLLSHPDRKYTRGFLVNWVIRSKNIINPDKFHNNNKF
jgi:hypothetical protein